MKIYLVGGAVRDKLLGLSVKERDWVVVGSSAAEMLQKGFRQVGKDFPVFLHPKTNEEYALARMERKTGSGYAGFAFDASPTVTLEDDLERRDLTINAMAETIDGQLVDPYQGQADLRDKILRHVSAAFVEDPVRILRVARFAARFAALGFHVAPDTYRLMKHMVASGEVNALVAERVWKELERALAEPHPEQFFHVLTECDALPILFAEIHFALPALQRVVLLSHDPVVRFAAVFQENALPMLKKLGERYRIPNNYRELVELVHQFLPFYQRAPQLSAEELVQLLQRVDAFRRETRFHTFLLVCEACSVQSHSALLQASFAAAAAINVKELIVGLQGEEIAARILDARVKKVADILKARGQS